ncbi:MAG: DUF3108 domain-containing protein [Leptospirales bacterium]
MVKARFRIFVFSSITAIALAVFHFYPLSGIYAKEKKGEVQKPWKVGEVLHYTVYYKVGYIYIPGVRARLTIVKESDENNSKVLHISGSAVSNKLVDLFFKVRDSISCAYDWKNRVPLWDRKSLREGNYFREYEALFHNHARTATFSQKEFNGNTDVKGVVNKNAKWKEKKGTISKLKPYTQSVCSSIFYLRHNAVSTSIGSSIVIPLFDDGKKNSLKLTVVEKKKVEIEAGIFAALVLKPKYKKNGAFTSKGKTMLYVSDDKNRYLLKAESDLPVIGQILVELVKIE